MTRTLARPFALLLAALLLALLAAAAGSCVPKPKTPAGAPGGPAAKGAGATAYALIGGGAVTNFVISNPGVGYVGTVGVTLTGGYVTQEGGEMQLEFTGAPGDAMPVKDFLVPQLNAARERDVQATFVLTFNPGLPLAGDAAEKLGERLAKFASGAAYVSATAQAVP